MLVPTWIHVQFSRQFLIQLNDFSKEELLESLYYQNNISALILLD